MAVDVLQTQAQNAHARRELERRGLAALDRRRTTRWLSRLGLRDPGPGDLLKSWDVLKTAELLAERCAPGDAIADFGAFRSEILHVLARLGFRNLHGIDLNPKILEGRQRSAIDYVCGSFLESPYPDGSLAAITSISAIEHGNTTEALLTEVARVLRPGGLFVASTDYWPDKVSTAGVQVFGMDWTIYSADELRALFEVAAAKGLRLLGEANFAASDRVVRFADRQYTFAWFALERAPSGSRGP